MAKKLNVRKDTMKQMFHYVKRHSFFIALSIYAYNHRKSEKAGEPYAFKAVPTAICFIVSFISLFSFGRPFIRCITRFIPSRL